MGLANATERAEVAESLAALRRSTAQWLTRERDRTRLGTGIPRLDAVLAGGWPQGRLSEIVGTASAGASGIAAASVAAATGRGEVVAWIDAADALDPVAVRAAGVELERVLWVRPQSLDESVRVAELILDTGGFSLVVLDPGAMGRTADGRRWAAKARVRANVNRVPASSGGRRNRGKGALPLRLARAVERAAAVLLVLTCRSWAGTLAAVTVKVEGEGALWGDAERRGPRWLVGFSSTARLERGGGDGRQRRTALHFENAPALGVRGAWHGTLRPRLESETDADPGTEDAGVGGWIVSRAPRSAPRVEVEAQVRAG